MEEEHQAWLDLVVEEALEPELPVCDPHHHLWDHPTDTYLLDELRADTGSGHNVVSTVFVECMSKYRSDGPEGMRPVGETEFVAAEATRSETSGGSVIAGIVSYADLTLGEAVEEVLSAHDDAGGGRFRGIRHASSWDASDDVRNSHTNPPPGLLTQDGFRAGFAALGRMGFGFDAWMYHPQLPELVDLCRAVPDTPVVLDHLGGPLGIGPYAGVREDVMAQWRESMAAVAACPNVTLKLGGIGMPIFGLDLHRRDEPPTSEEMAEAWGGPIRWCIEQFGADRCMFESNFPVDKRSVSYGILFNAFKRIAAGASDAERTDLFHDTAVRAYRL